MAELTIRPGELIRDAMSKGYRESGKIEWTRREIAEALGGVLNAVQLSNALQQLARNGKVITTESVPSAERVNKRGTNAKYWALTSVIDKATQPTATPTKTPVATPTESEQEEVNSPVVTHADLDNLTAALTTEIEKQIHLAFSDFRKSLDNKLTGIAAPRYDDDFNKLRNMIGAENEVDKKLYAQLVKTLERILTGIYKMGEATAGMIEDINKADEVDKEAFARGFKSGWLACEETVREAITKGIENQSKKKPEGVLAIIPKDSESIRNIQTLKGMFNITD